MIQPKVSVIMSVYNGAQYVADAIKSILAQTFENWEFIIINDGSTDNTPAILHSFQDDRLRFVEQPNLGLTVSLNKAISLARGEYIARQDADDVSLPERLAVQVVFLDAHSEIAIVGTACYVTNERRQIKFVMAHPLDHASLRWELLFDSAFVHGTVMMRRGIIEKLGGYNKGGCYKYVEDYELWSRVSKHYPVANINKPLLYYMDNPRGVSHSKRQVQQRNTEAISINNLNTLIGLNNLSKERIRYLRYLYAGLRLLIPYQQMAKVVTDIFRVHTIFRKVYGRELRQNPLSDKIIRRKIRLKILGVIARCFLTLHLFLALKLLIIALDNDPGIVRELFSLSFLTRVSGKITKITKSGRYKIFNNVT